MSDGVKLWCFLLLLPFFAAIGHDLYANYFATEEKQAQLEALQIDPAAYQMSDFGYLFMTYTPDEFMAARDAVGEEAWTTWVDPILRMYTFVVALIPAMLFFTWLLISRIFDIWPFAGQGPVTAKGTGHRSRDRLAQYDKRNDPAQFKYKRR